jgi:acyl carrier protein
MEETPVLTDREILDGIAAIAREHLGWERELDPSMRLADLELDSLKSLTLVVEVENRFRVCLDPESEGAIASVGDLVTTVRRLHAGIECDPE